MDWKRDEVRDELFLSTHGIKPTVYIKYELNPNFTFKTFTLKYKVGDKEWDLNEFYAEDNSTAYCTLTGTDEVFDNPKGAFNDAENKLVELMKEGK